MCTNCYTTLVPGLPAGRLAALRDVSRGEAYFLVNLDVRHDVRRRQRRTSDVGNVVRRQRPTSATSDVGNVARRQRPTSPTSDVVNVRRRQRPATYTATSDVRRRTTTCEDVRTSSHVVARLRTSSYALDAVVRRLSDDALKCFKHQQHIITPVGRSITML